MGLRLVGHRLGEEGLPRPRGTVEQDPGGGIDPEAGEQLRVLEGQLHHFLELLDDRLDSPDVLVGDLPDRRALLLHGGPGLELDPGLLRHPDDSVRDRAGHHEADLHQAEGRGHEEPFQQVVGDGTRGGGLGGMPEETGGDDVSLHEGTVQEGRTERLSGSGDPESLPGGGQEDGLRLLPPGQGELHELPDPDPGVAPDQAVHPDDLDPFILGVVGEDDRRGEPLSLDPNDPPLLQPEGLHLLDPQPDDPLSHVLLDRLRDPDSQNLVRHGCLLLRTRNSAYHHSQKDAGGHPEPPVSEDWSPPGLEAPPSHLRGGTS